MADIELTASVVSGRTIAAADMILGWDASGTPKSDTLRAAVQAGFLGTLANTDDLDTTITPGFYSVVSPLNRPVDSRAAVLVAEAGTGEVYQRWFGDDGHEFFRTRTGSTWSSWTQAASLFASDDEIVAGTDDTTVASAAGVALAMSERDRDHVRDITLPSGHAAPRALMTDGTYIHSFETTRNAIAYNAKTRARVSGADWIWNVGGVSGRLYGGNYYGGYYWLCVGNSIHAFNTSALYQRDTTAEPSSLASANGAPVSIVFDESSGDRWVINSDRKVFRYDTTWTVANAGGEYTLDAANTSIADAWSDGARHMWVLSSTGRAFCYETASGTRRPSRDIRVANGSTYGIVSDNDRTLWIAMDGTSQDVLEAYYLPGEVRPITSASEDEEGIVKRVTTAIARAGADDALYTTTKAVVEIIRTQVVAATNARAGTVRLPTAAEVAAASTTAAVPTVSDVDAMITASASSGTGTGTSVGSASTETAGIVELATRAEARAQTHTNVATTPASLKDYLLVASAEFNLDATHFAPRGLASGVGFFYSLGRTSGTGAPTHIFQYKKSDGALETSSALATGNADGRDLTVTGGKVWVLDHDKTIYAYNASTLAHIPGDDWTTNFTQVDGLAATADEFVLYNDATKRVRLHTISNPTSFNRFGVTATATTGFAFAEAFGSGTTNATSTAEYYWLAGNTIRGVARKSLGVVKVTFPLDPANTNPFGFCYDSESQNWLVLDSTDRLCYAYDFTTHARLAPGKLPQASVSVLGGGKMATDAQQQTGTSRELISSPASVAALTSTTTRAGLIVTATPTEVTTGTDTSKAATPEGVKAAIDSAVGGSPTVASKDITLTNAANRFHGFTSDGIYLYILTTVNTIQKIRRSDGSLTATFALDTANTNATDIAYHDGYVFVIDNGHATIAAFAYNPANGNRQNAQDIPTSSLQSGNTTRLRLVFSESRLYISDQGNRVYAYANEPPYAGVAGDNVALTHTIVVPGSRGLAIVEYQGLEHLLVVETDTSASIAYLYSLSTNTIVAGKTVAQIPAMRATSGAWADLGVLYIGDEHSSGPPILRVFNPHTLEHLTTGVIPYATTDVAGLLETATDDEVIRRRRRDVALTPGHLPDMDASTSVRGLTRYAVTSEAASTTVDDKAMTPRLVNVAIDHREEIYDDVLKSGTGITDGTHKIPTTPAIMELFNAQMFYVGKGIDIKYGNIELTRVSQRGALTCLAIKPGTWEAWVNHGVHLARINLFTGTFHTLPQSPLNAGSLQAMTWHNGQLYALTTGGRLLSCNPTTGAHLYIGTLTVTGPQALFSNGYNLFAIGSGFNQAPRTLSTTTAQQFAVVSRTGANEVESGITTAFRRPTRPTASLSYADRDLIGYKPADNSFYGGIVSGGSAPVNIGTVDVPVGFAATDIKAISVAAGGIPFAVVSGTTGGGLYRIEMAGARV